MFCGREPPLRIDEGAQVFESVCGHQSGSRELPQRVFDDTSDLTRVLDDICEERRAAAAQRLEHLARSTGQALLLILRLSNNGGPSCRCIKQPRCVIAQKKRNRRRSCRPHAPRGAVLTSLLVVERRMRRQPAPHHLARNAELIEQLWRVLANSPPEYITFPRRR